MIEASGETPVVVDYMTAGWSRPQLDTLLQFLVVSAFLSADAQPLAAGGANSQLPHNDERIEVYKTVYLAEAARSTLAPFDPVSRKAITDILAALIKPGRTSDSLVKVVGPLMLVQGGPLMINTSPTKLKAAWPDDVALRVGATIEGRAAALLAEIDGMLIAAPAKNYNVLKITPADVTVTCARWPTPPAQI